MPVAMACMMMMLTLLYGTPATVTMGLRPRDWSLGKWSTFLTGLPLLPQALSL